MMFSRAIPVVLFTLFSISVAGSYLANGRQPLTYPGSMSEAQREALDVYYSEMKFALQVGDIERFEELISSQIAVMEAGAESPITPDVLPEPYANLRDFVLHGSVRSTAKVLDQSPNIDLNAPLGRYGAVALVWATSRTDGAPEMVQLLLDRGADPYFRSAQGYNLMHATASPFNYYYDDQDMEDLLELLPSALVTQVNGAGLTPLHLALINSQPALVAGLLRRGADPNAPPPTHATSDYYAGYPPLMIAGGNVEMVRALLEAGADPLAEDAAGRSILTAVTEGAVAADRDLQDRLSASAAEESDRAYAADYARARDMIRAAVDGRMASDS